MKSILLKLSVVFREAGVTAVFPRGLVIPAFFPLWEIPNSASNTTLRHSRTGATGLRFDD